MISLTLEDYLSLLFAKQSPMLNYVVVDAKTVATLALEPEHKLYVSWEPSEASSEVFKLYKLNVWEEEYKLRLTRKALEEQERKTLCHRAELVAKAVARLSTLMNVEPAMAKMFLEMNLRDAKANRTFLVKLGLEEIL